MTDGLVNPNPQTMRRLSFSLRTLLLAVLMAGTGFLVADHWAPWRVMVRLQIRPPVLADNGTADFQIEQTDVFFSLDGKTVYVWGEFFTPRTRERKRRSCFAISAFDTASGTIRWRREQPDLDSVQVMWSPGRQWLGVSYGRTYPDNSPYVRIIRADSGEPLRWPAGLGEVLDAPGHKVRRTSVCLSPDDEMADVCHERLYYVFRPTTGEEICRFFWTKSNTGDGPLAFSEDGKWLAYHERPLVRLRRLQDNYPWHFFPGYDAAFIPRTGRLVVNEDFTTSDQVYDLETGKPTDTVDFADYEKLKTTWIETGSEGTVSWDGLREVRTPSKEMDRIEIRVKDGGGLLCSIPVPNAPLERARFSPTGDLFAVLGKNGTVDIWERLRPERWWGIFWRWPSWLFCAMAAAVMCSHWADRICVRRARHREREA